MHEVKPNWLADLVYWLSEEFRAMAPRRKAEVHPPAAIVRVGRNGFAIRSPKAGGPEAMVVQDAAAAVAALRDRFSQSRNGGNSVSIEIAPERYLARHVSELRLPRSRLMAMARLDMQAATPFQPDEVHIVCTGYDGTAPGSGYYIVKKSFIDPLLNAIRSSGTRINGIRFDGTGKDDEQTRANLVLGENLLAMTRPSRMARFARGVTIATILLAVTGGAATIAHAHLRYRTASVQLDDVIERARSEATGVRRLIEKRNEKINQISLVREQKQSSVPAAVILEELARIIPDSAWVTEIDLSSANISFNGVAKSAASLIPILEESPLFRSPTFKSPVVRGGNRAGETFSITMEIEVANG